MKKDSTTPPVSGERPVWSTPKLQELGNLRTLVQMGAAHGKSGAYRDSPANCGGEAMNAPGPGC
jgi:hypothetical protein